MPIYEYKCNKCGYEIEKFILNIDKMEAEEVICPLCKNICKKQISQSTFHLKGSGWTV